MVSVALRMTQSDLAAWVAASREQINRALAGFRTRGLIEMDGGQSIVIVNRRGLQQELWRG